MLCVYTFWFINGEYIFLHTECFFNCSILCLDTINYIIFLSKYVHFTRPNDIRGGALTLKNLATLDVDGESLATSSAGNIDISKKKIIKKGFFGMPVK